MSGGRIGNVGDSVSQTPNVFSLDQAQGGNALVAGLKWAFTTPRALEMLVHRNRFHLDMQILFRTWEYGNEFLSQAFALKTFALLFFSCCSLWNDFLKVDSWILIQRDLQWDDCPRSQAVRVSRFFSRYYGLQTASLWPYERSCLSDSQCQFGKQCTRAQTKHGLMGSWLGCLIAICYVDVRYCSALYFLFVYFFVKSSIL